MLGNGRLEAYCFDGKQRQCHIRGKMRKKVWVGAGDIILVSLRDYQDDKGAWGRRGHAGETQRKGAHAAAHMPSPHGVSAHCDALMHARGRSV